MKAFVFRLPCLYRYYRNDLLQQKESGNIHVLNMWQFKRCVERLSIFLKPNFNILPTAVARCLSNYIIINTLIKLQILDCNFYK